jgi:hypothetical protein
MEVYHVYLRTFIMARTCGDIATEGAATTVLAAMALAVHDAMHGRDPRPASSLIPLVADMCKEGPSCA